MKSEIPNITGYSTDAREAVGAWGGAFKYLEDSEWGYTGGDYKFMKTTFDASSCSDRYGSYPEVNPLYTSCKFIIHY